MRDEVAMAEPSELLAEYASTGSEEAFRGVVEFYLGLVFSACCRQLRDRHLAEDATQAVFLLLSEKAGSVAGDRLGGWLLTTSRFVCANIRKSRQRRQRREQVVAMNRDESSERTNSTDLLDFLDDALGRLSAGDREALILSFLREQPIAQVAANLAVSEPAARKRVARAMEKLRGYFRRRGITADSSLLAGVLSEQLRGSGLSLEARRAVAQGVIRVVRAPIPGSGPGVAIAKGTKAMMLINQVKLAAIAAAAVAALATGGWGIFRGFGGQSLPAPAKAVQAATPMPQVSTLTLPASAPATQPAMIDLTTPRGALRSFFYAMWQGDRDSTYACLDVDPNRAPTLMDGIIAQDLAQNRLIHAGAATFGGDGSGFRNGVTLDSVAELIANVPPAEIEGDSATFTIRIPPQLIALAPQNYRDILAAWASARLHVERREGKWQFDIDRSMRVAGNVQLHGTPTADPSKMTPIFLATAQAYDRVAKAILEHRYPTEAAAEKGLNSAVAKVRRKFGVESEQTTVLPADAPPTTQN
jgi:RNA polymerase sigma factor (sigma-70 family)